MKMEKVLRWKKYTNFIPLLQIQPVIETWHFLKSSGIKIVTYTKLIISNFAQLLQN